MNLKFSVGSHGYTLFNDDGNIEVVDLGRPMTIAVYNKLFRTIDDWVGPMWDYDDDEYGHYEVFLKKD